MARERVSVDVWCMNGCGSLNEKCLALFPIGETVWGIMGPSGGGSCWEVHLWEWALRVHSLAPLLALSLASEVWILNFPFQMPEASSNMTELSPLELRAQISSSFSSANSRHQTVTNTMARFQKTKIERGGLLFSFKNVFIIAVCVCVMCMYVCVCVCTWWCVWEYRWCVSRHAISEDNFQNSALAFPFVEAGALAVSAVGHTWGCLVYSFLLILLL